MLKCYYIVICLTSQIYSTIWSNWHYLAGDSITINHSPEPNSENLLYLNPGVARLCLCTMPSLLALEKLPTDMFLYFEFVYFPGDFSIISSVLSQKYMKLR